MLPQVYIDALACSFLAVGGWGLERVWSQIENLRQANLLDPSSVAVMQIEEIVPKFVKHGYDRGKLNGFMAERYKIFMTAIDEGQLDSLTSFLENNDREGAIALLTKLKFVGPWVAKNALLRM